MLLALALLPTQAAAAAPCPTWRERQTMSCMRGYVRVDPAALAVVGGHGSWVHDFPDGRLGYATGVAVGMFRSFGKFALGVGGRFGYARHDHRSPWSRVVEGDLHAGPEVRLGAASERVFGYALLRGGYSRWSQDVSLRTSLAPPDRLHGGHYGLGAGIWGRIGRRFLLGGEVASDMLRFDYRQSASTLTVSLTLGAWL